MNLRFKTEAGENRFPHILNGSGTALARLFVALVETVPAGRRQRAHSARLAAVAENRPHRAAGVGVHAILPST